MQAIAWYQCMVPRCQGAAQAHGIILVVVVAVAVAVAVVAVVVVVWGITL